MEQISKVFVKIFSLGSKIGQPNARNDIYREWDRQRARALTPSDQAEIDAIFSRAV